MYVCISFYFISSEGLQALVLPPQDGHLTELQVLVALPGGGLRLDGFAVPQQLLGQTWPGLWLKMDGRSMEDDGRFPRSVNLVSKFKMGVPNWTCHGKTRDFATAIFGGWRW